MIFLNSLAMLNEPISEFNIESWMVLIWLGVFIAAVIIEFSTNELVSIWFAGGALMAVILAAIPVQEITYWIEIIVFSVVSVLLLCIIRPLSKKALIGKELKSNVEEIIGKKAEVVKDVDKLHHGEVKIGGAIWTAVLAETSEEVKVGEIVRILAIEGNKVIVQNIEKEIN